MARNRYPAPTGDHIFPLNMKLLEKLNTKAYAGLSEDCYNKAYYQTERDAHALGRYNHFCQAGPVLISKACAVYEDLHVFSKKTRAELLALYKMASGSNESLAAKCYAALSYKYLAGERP